MQSREQRLAELLKKFGLDDVGEETVGNSSTDESKVINTPPATAETPVVPPSRARDILPKYSSVNKSDNIDSHNSQYINKPDNINSFNSQCINNNININISAVSARAREDKNRKASDYRNWRIAMFGGDIDPVAEAVGEALRAFKPSQPEIDRPLWLKICNRVGYQNFLDAVFEQKSLFRDLESSGKHYANKAAIFQRLLNKRFPLPKSKGGAK